MYIGAGNIMYIDAGNILLQYICACKIMVQEIYMLQEINWCRPHTATGVGVGVGVGVVLWWLLGPVSKCQATYTS